MIVGLEDLNGVDVTSAVRAYLDADLAVFPCQAGGKKPATKRGFKDAVSMLKMVGKSETEVRTFLSGVETVFSEGGNNVGLPTGTHFDVLDVDVKDGKPGLAALRTLRDAGLLQGSVATAKTPSGGWHVMYPPAGQRSRSLPMLGLDLKAEGGYVLASPSVIMSVSAIGSVEMRRYEWVQSRAVDEGEPLDWEAVCAVLGVRKMEQPRRYSHSLWGDVPIEVVVAGLADWVGHQTLNRNSAVYWAANRAVEAGARSVDVLRPLVEASLRVYHPGDEQENREEELMKTIRSAVRRFEQEEAEES